MSRGARNLRETYLRVMHALRMQAWPPPDALLGWKMFHVHVNVLKTQCIISVGLQCDVQQ